MHLKNGGGPTVPDDSYATGAAGPGVEPEGNPARLEKEIVGGEHAHVDAEQDDLVAAAEIDHGVGADLGRSG